MASDTFTYRGVRYVEAAPPPVPSDAIPDDTKKDVCQVVNFLAESAKQTKERLDASGLSDDRIDSAISIFTALAAEADAALGGSCSSVTTGSALHRALVHFAAGPPPVPKGELQKKLKSVMTDVKTLAGATDDAKKLLVGLGMTGAEDVLKKAKMLLSDVFNELLKSGMKRITENAS